MERIQVDVSSKTSLIFAKLKKEERLSKGQVVDRAVAAYDTLNSHFAKGDRIFIVDKFGKEKEIILL